MKNMQNHILESYISLMSSMSSNILHSIYNDILLKCIFIPNQSGNPFEGQLATDLRIYLLKFLDKIVTISQGDVVLNSAFLDSIIECKYPSPESLSKKSNYLGANSIPVEGMALNKEAIKLRENANQTISLAC